MYWHNPKKTRRVLITGLILMGIGLIVVGIKLWQLGRQKDLGIYEQSRIVEIELELEHPQVRLELASDYQVLAEWLVKKLGWGEGWQEYSLSRMSEGQEEMSAGNWRILPTTNSATNERI